MICMIYHRRRTFLSKQSNLQYSYWRIFRLTTISCLRMSGKLNLNRKCCILNCISCILGRWPCSNLQDKSWDKLRLTWFLDNSPSKHRCTRKCCLDMRYNSKPILNILHIWSHTLHKHHFEEKFRQHNPLHSLKNLQLIKDILNLVRSWYRSLDVWRRSCMERYKRCTRKFFNWESCRRDMFCSKRHPEGKFYPYSRNICFWKYKQYNRQGIQHTLRLPGSTLHCTLEYSCFLTTREEQYILSMLCSKCRFHNWFCMENILHWSWWNSLLGRCSCYQRLVGIQSCKFDMSERLCTLRSIWNIIGKAWRHWKRYRRKVHPHMCMYRRCWEWPEEHKSRILWLMSILRNHHHMACKFHLELRRIRLNKYRCIQGSWGLSLQWLGTRGIRQGRLHTYCTICLTCNYFEYMNHRSKHDKLACRCKYCGRANRILQFCWYFCRRKYIQWHLMSRSCIMMSIFDRLEFHFRRQARSILAGIRKDLIGVFWILWHHKKSKLRHSGMKHSLDCRQYICQLLHRKIQ